MEWRGDKSVDWLMNLLPGGFQACGWPRSVALTTTDIRTRLDGLLCSGDVGLSTLLFFFQVTKDKHTTLTTHSPSAPSLPKKEPASKLYRNARGTKSTGGCQAETKWKSFFTEDDWGAVCVNVWVCVCVQYMWLFVWEVLYCRAWRTVCER